jgi:hypothetical protein
MTAKKDRARPKAPNGTGEVRTKVTIGMHDPIRTIADRRAVVHTEKLGVKVSLGTYLSALVLADNARSADASYRALARYLEAALTDHPLGGTDLLRLVAS